MSALMMMADKLWLRILCSKTFKVHKNVLRTVLSEAYACDNAWQRRLESPLLKHIDMSQYFVEVDRKFQTKRLASSVDIDLFANNVENESELDELEHLLYRFRKTKRAIEIMDSTQYATIKAFLKFKNYESLLKILDDRVNYGVFPNFYSYNMMMDTFLKQKMYRDAAEVAVLMMLQEDFSNPISRILGLYSCQMFLKEGSLNTWDKNPPKEENKNEDDEEDVFVRIPFLRNPWFDDHFDIENPKHLIGKTLYLIGQEEDNILGRTYQLIGLGMYEKWEKAANFLESLSNFKSIPVIHEEAVSKFKEMLHEIQEDENGTKEKWLAEFTAKFQKMEGKVENGDLNVAMQKKLEEIPNLEKVDIEAQEALFLEWEKSRKEAFDKQLQELDKEKRLKVITEKKEYLYWKEKLLFFFENQEQILNEHEKVKKIIAEQKSKISVDDAYEPPEIVKKPPVKLSKLRRKAIIKVL